MAREIISKSVELPLDIFNAEVKILHSAQPTKLMRREVALTQEPAKCEMVTINMDWNAIKQRTPMIEGIDNH